MITQAFLWIMIKRTIVIGYIIVWFKNLLCRIPRIKLLFQSEWIWLKMNHFNETQFYWDNVEGAESVTINFIKILPGYGVK